MAGRLGRIATLTSAALCSCGVPEGPISAPFDGGAPVVDASPDARLFGGESGSGRGVAPPAICRESGVDGLDDDGNGLKDDTPELCELFQQTVRFSVDVRLPASGFVLDHYPPYDFDPDRAQPALAVYVFPQFFNAPLSTPFPEPETARAAFVAPDPSSPDHAYFRITGRFSSGADFAGSEWLLRDGQDIPADLRRWPGLRLRLRARAPGVAGKVTIELKLKDHAGTESVVPGGIELPSDGGWVDWEHLDLPRLLPDLDWSRMKSIVFAFTASGTGVDPDPDSVTDVVLELQSAVFLPTEARRVDANVSCAGAARDPVCTEAITGADKVAFALLLVAGADSLGLAPDGVDARRIVHETLQSLRAIPRWAGAWDPSGDALLETSGRGLPPNWFGAATGLLSPHDKTISLTDVADLVAVMQVLQVVYARSAPDIAARALEEETAMLSAVRALTTGCPSHSANAAIVLGPDPAHPVASRCGWQNTIRMTDNLLGWFESLVAQATRGEDWATGLNGCANQCGGNCEPASECPLDRYPADGRCGDSETRCWYHLGGIDATECSDECPPGMASGGTFVHCKPLIFIDSKRMPTSGMSLSQSLAELLLAQEQSARARGFDLFGHSAVASPSGPEYLTDCASIDWVFGGSVAPFEIFAPSAAACALEVAPDRAWNVIEVHRTLGMTNPYRVAPDFPERRWGLRASYLRGSEPPDRWLMLDQGYIGAHLLNHMSNWIRASFGRSSASSAYLAVAGHRACDRAP